MGVKHLSFTGQSGCYAVLPLSVLPGATEFTIEVEFSTKSTKNNTYNWTWGTIAGREIDGNWRDDFGLCVNNGKLCFWAEPVAGNSLYSSTGGVFSNAVVNDGSLHKVAVVSSNSAIYLYCDGQLVANVANVNAKTPTNYSIMLAYDGNANSYLQMDLFEARFWNVARNREQIFADIDGSEEGLQAWYLPSQGALNDYSGHNNHATLYGSPTFTDLANQDFTIDLKRKVKNAPLTWRYENAGTADDLITSGTTFENLPETESKTGTAFYQTAKAKCFDLPTTPEIWLKFDVYFDGSNRWRAYNGGTNGATGICSYVGYSVDFGLWQNDTKIQDFSGVCKTNQLQTVLLHMISGTTDGIVEAWVGGTKIYRYTGNVNNGQDFADIYLQSDGSGTFFSNVIISNAEIGLTEDVAINTIDVKIKPEVFASWIPCGEINFKPELFATIIDDGVRCEFSVDLCRKIVRSETSAVDLCRKITNTVDFTADLKRTLFKAETFAVDTQRTIVRSVDMLVDTCRKVSNKIDFAVDTRCKLTKSVSFDADLKRVVTGAVDFTVDLQTRFVWRWLTRILPESSFLDSKMFASAEALDAEITKFHLAIREVLHLPRLDELSGTILDLLAEQFHVDYYDAINFGDKEKRNLIRQSIAWHRIKGTPAAVEMILQDAFKDLRIDEWFTYGGEPYFFRIWCRGYKSTPERFKSFWLMFMDAKNVRSHLEQATIDISPEEPIKIYTGVAHAVSGLKTVGLPRPKDKFIQLYTSVARIQSGLKKIGLPSRPRQLNATIYVGVVIVRSGTIFVGMKSNPF